MLQVPAYGQVNGVTLFPDDALFYKFYPVPGTPRVRTDANGRPVFLLVKYAVSDEDRIANPTLPPGGGYVSFDVVFDVSADDLRAIAGQLQPQVNARWDQLRHGTAEEQARPGVAGTNAPPQVQLGTPTWTTGKVSLDAPQAKELVSARVSESVPSLLTGNVTAFSMDLTPAGADFLQRTLVPAPGAGGDLTPLQVRYDLEFWARLPPVRIHVRADSQKVHEYVHKVLEGRGIDACTTYDFDHTVIDEETLKASGAIDVQIDTGSGAVPDPVIEELRQYSLELVKQMVQATFFTNTPPAGTPADPDPQTGGGGTKKFFKRQYNDAEMHIQLDLEQRSVVAWSIHPQATLETFFRGLSADDLKQFVRQIKLDDDFFKNLQLNVRAFTDFTDPAVAAVEVQVKYAGIDDGGQPREKDQTFTFTGPDPQKWSVGLIASQRQYQYRYRVDFKNQEAGPFSAWQASSSPDLNVVVPAPGRVDLDVLAGDIDFDTQIQQVQVVVAYDDPASNVSHEEGVVILDASHREGRYQRTIYKARLRPVRYRCRFRTKAGDVQEGDWQDAPGPIVVVNQPFTQSLRVSLLPAGDGWDDVTAVAVELGYSDPAHNYTVSDSLTLKSKDEFRTWRVALKDPSAQDFKYRWLTSFKNGHLEDSGWKAATGSGTYPVVVARRGLRVTFLGDLLDFTAAPLTEVHLHYAAAGVDAQETMTFHDKAAQSWALDVPQGAPVEYTYQVTHYPASGPPVVLPAVTAHDTVVILPRFAPPAGGTMAVAVFATLVDFAATPLVTVDLRYDDDANDVHAVGALTFTNNQTQTWSVTVKDLSRRTFGYKVTYFTATGAEAAGPAKAQDAPRVIIPRYTP